MPRIFNRRAWQQDTNFWYQITDSSTSYDSNETAGWWFTSTNDNNFSITNTTMEYIRTYDGYRVPRFSDGRDYHYSVWHQYHHPEDQMPEERLLRGNGLEAAVRDANQDLRQRDREQRREAEEERRQAFLRATSLLHEALSPEQSQQLTDYDAFLVVGSKTRNTYEIIVGREHNVFLIVSGQRTRQYCVHVVDRVPNADNALAQKFMIECNEEMFLRLANVMWLPRAQPSRVPVPTNLQSVPA